MHRTAPPGAAMTCSGIESVGAPGKPASHRARPSDEARRSEVPGATSGFSLRKRVRSLSRSSTERNQRSTTSPSLASCFCQDSSSGIESNFRLLADRISLVHINVLYSGYPYRDLFRLLRSTGYAGFTLAEIPGCGDLEQSKMLLNYYKALWTELCRN